MPRALVTGIAGFAGSWLAEHLLEEGDEVAGFLLASTTEEARRRLGASAERVALHEGDLLDPAALSRALDAARPERVYHLAGFSSPRLSIEDPLACWRVNALGTATLLDAIRRSGARPRTLVIGSAAAYGRAAGPDPITEATPLRPLTPYGASKVAAEVAAIAAFASDGTPAVVARSFNHLGPRQEPVFAAPAFARQVALAEAGRAPPEVRAGNLDPVRDLTDVRDVVRAYRLLAERGRPGEVYNVCSGRGVAMREVVTGLIALARRPLAIVLDPALVRGVEEERVVGSPARLARETGWAPRHALAETLALVLEDWRRRVASP